MLARGSISQSGGQHGGADSNAGQRVPERRPARGSVSRRKLTLEQLRSSAEQTGGLEQSRDGCWIGVWQSNPLNVEAGGMKSEDKGNPITRLRMLGRGKGGSTGDRSDAVAGPVNHRRSRELSDCTGQGMEVSEGLNIHGEEAVRARELEIVNMVESIRGMANI
eukprot:g36536.t1